MDGVDPVAVPSNAINSRETAAAAPDVLVSARPLLTARGWPGVPLAST